METDLAYYRRRSVEETAAAAAASHPKARIVHLELARRYDERAGLLATEAGGPIIQLVPAG